MVHPGNIINVLGIKRMIGLIILAIKSNIFSSFTKPGELFLSIAGTLINNSLYVYGFYLIAQMSLFKNHDVANMFFVVTGLFTTAWGVVNLVSGGLMQIGQLIETGELDRFLVFPRNPLLLIAISKTEIVALADILQGLIVLVYLGVNLGSIFVLKMALAIIVSIVSLIGLVIIGGSLSFLTERGGIISSVFVQTIVSTSLFPISNTLRGKEKFIIYLSPLLFTSFLPTQIMYMNSWHWLIYGLLGSNIFLILSVILFNFLIKNYRSGNAMSVSR